MGGKYAEVPVDDVDQVTGQTKLDGPSVSVNKHDMG
jgi:hypothetical protein